MSIILDPNQENRQSMINYVQSKDCIICFDNKINTTCLPCGHTIMCEDCEIEYRRGDMNTCPVCRIELNIIVGIENSVDWAKENNKPLIVTNS
jgi:hypothetical protein